MTNNGEKSAPIWQIETLYSEDDINAVVEIRLDIADPTAYADLNTTYQQFPSQIEAAMEFLAQIATHPEAGFREEDVDAAHAVIVGHDRAIVVVDEVCEEHGGRNFAYQYVDETFIRIAEFCEGCTTVIIQLESQKILAERAARPAREVSQRSPHPQF